MHGGRYRYDFYLPKLNILIEVDGPHHTKQIYTRKEFMAGKERDRRKNSYALANNIPLYPVGTKVKLGGTDNSYAIVIENFEKIRDYHRPKVLTVPGNKEIDLRKETTITIISVVSSEVEFSKLYTQQAEETRVYRHM